LSFSVAFSYRLRYKSYSHDTKLLKFAHEFTPLIKKLRWNPLFLFNIVIINNTRIFGRINTYKLRAYRVFFF